MTSPTGDADLGRISIRRARADDAPELARLAGELGYPSAADQMRRRLQTIEARADHAVFAAERGAGAPGACAGRAAAALLGWIHVASRILLESGEFAEILGLVVVGGARREGVGRRLVVAAEQWGRALALQRIVVRSNAVRTESHEFYPALDYALAKSQRVYVKQLG